MGSPSRVIYELVSASKHRRTPLLSQQIRISASLLIAGQIVRSKVQSLYRKEIVVSDALQVRQFNHQRRENEFRGVRTASTLPCWDTYSDANLITILYSGFDHRGCDGAVIFFWRISYELPTPFSTLMLIRVWGLLTLKFGLPR